MGLRWTFDADSGHVSYKWADNMNLIYTNWGEGQPARPEGDSGCVEFLENGSWSIAQSCASAYKFICKIEMVFDPHTDDDLGDSKCDPGWSLVTSEKGDEDNKYCYKPFLDPMDWGDAEYECSSYGAHLMSIHSEYELKFAQSLSGKKSIFYFISYNDHKI